MKDGFIRVAAATPDIKVADPVFNAEKIWDMIAEGKEKGAKVMVFPELALTGYTCGDLFLQDVLVETAKNELKKLIEKTEGMDMLAFVGLPWEKNGKLYWIGNVTDHRVSGNFPRWPLCIARVDETWGTLKKDTLTVIDTVRPEESRQVQLSNFSFWQNRETGKLELFVTKIGQFPDETVWKSEVWHYGIGIE
jgi:predicted amidohydrolase